VTPTLGATGARPAGAVERLDPRTRVLLAIGFAIAVAAQDDLTRLAVATLAAVALLVAARPPAALLRRRLLATEGLVALIVLTLPFTVPGDPYAAIGPLSVSGAGLARAAAVALRVNAIALSVLALLGTLEAARLTGALTQLRVPTGLVQTLAFATRYVAVLEDERRRLLLGMRARGFRPRADLHTYRSIGTFVGALVVRAFDRAERVLEAMRCRGFDGRFAGPSGRAYPRREGALGALVAAALAAFALGGPA
jgi:cobalt/nickel transport system permease protein